MADIALIGAKGLVGSAFARYFTANAIPFTPILRTDMEHASQIEARLVINCCGSGQKGKANQNPAWDFRESVTAVVHYVHSLACDQFVHVSSVDVYADASSLTNTQEDAQQNSANLSVYGYHKTIAEHYVRKFAPAPLILRLPGLVGPGLNKNPVYDHTHQHKKLFVTGASEMNFIHTDHVARLAMELIEISPIERTFNLAARNSLKIADLPSITGRKNIYHAEDTLRQQDYQINTSLASKYLSLPTSEASILAYMDDLRPQDR